MKAKTDNDKKQDESDLKCDKPHRFINPSDQIAKMILSPSTSSNNFIKSNNSNYCKMSKLESLINVVNKKPPFDDGDGSNPPIEHNTSIFNDLVHLKLPQIATIFQLVKQLASGKPINDRELLLEHIVTFMQKLPNNSSLEHKVSDAFIHLLWNDLTHPPATFIGPEYRFRTADGSKNNPYLPLMGAANTPYARTVSPKIPKNPHLPDPGLIFDQLLRRKEGFIANKSGLNSFLFSFATLIIHILFQSNFEKGKEHLNLTSSYIDLSPIYGNNQEEQDKVRSFEQGLLWPDTIASERIMRMTPGVIALTILFSRHHNYLAKQLFEVNEEGKYKSWETLTQEEKVWQDNEIFQLSRNINCATFAKCVLTDYVGGLLSTPKANSDWSLDIGKEIKELEGTFKLERGTGNVVSCEFNVLYRWHATLSVADEKRMIEQFEKQESLKGIPPDQVTPQQFYQMAAQEEQELLKKPPKEWEFNGLKRGADGQFDDVDLAKIIKDCIEQPAHAFGARSTPSCFKAIEILGMNQARNSFKLCTLNEFREFLNLKKYENFIEWNPDFEIAQAAERLYGHIDNLELYPGLMAEQNKPNVLGSGLQPGQTIGRGLLGDAVALVRGDRFMTHDFNSYTLTNWGISQLKPFSGSYGGHLGNVLFRALPLSWGKGNSTYSALPFYTPKAIHQVLSDNGVLQEYDLHRPEPVYSMEILRSYSGVKEALEDPFKFSNLNFIEDLIQIKSDPTLCDSARKLLNVAFCGPSFKEMTEKYFKELTSAKIKECSLDFHVPSKTYQLDVVKEIFNVVPIYWLADKFGIPLKTKESPHGLITVYDLHKLLLKLVTFESNLFLPESYMGLFETIKKHTPTLCKILQARYETTSGIKGFFTNILTKGSNYALNEEAKEFYSKLHDNRMPMDQAVVGMIDILLPAAANLTVQPSLVLDLFLKPEYGYAKDRLIELAKKDDLESNQEFEMWIYEGMRVCSSMPAVIRKVNEETIIQDGEKSVNVKKDDLIVLSLSSARMDSMKFPNPEKLDPTRCKKDYLQYDLDFVMPGILIMMKEIFKLRQICREKGQSGQIVRTLETIITKGETLTIHKYLDNECQKVSGPASMIIEYEK